jgi:hypothetical protein
VLVSVLFMAILVSVLVSMMPAVVALLRVVAETGRHGLFPTRGAVWMPLSNLGGSLWRSGLLLPAHPFDDFVQFAPIEPDAPALRAVVDLHSLPFGQQERDIALRAFHL